MKTHKAQSGSVTAVRGTAKHKEEEMKITVKKEVWMTGLTLLLSATMFAGCDLGETVNPPAVSTVATETDGGADTETNVDAGEEVEITFDLPEEWRPAEQSGGGDLSWSTYIPSDITYANPSKVIPDEREQQHYWSFYLQTDKKLEGLRMGDGNTIKEVAESYYRETKKNCEMEYPCEENAFSVYPCAGDRTCDLLPFSEDTYEGVTVYGVKYKDRTGHPMAWGEYARYIAEKDGYYITFGIRGYLDDPITQQTVEQVVKSLTITEKKGSDS